MVGDAHARTVAWILASGLVLTGAVSIYLGLFPLQLGNAEWEVAAIGQVVAGAAAGAIGWGGISWLALTSPRLRWMARLIGFLGIILAVAMGFGAILVATNLPLVWSAARQADSIVRATAYKAAAVKAASLSGLYALFFLVFSAAVLRSSFTRK